MMVAGSIAGGLLASANLVLPFLVAALFQVVALATAFTLREPVIGQGANGRTRLRYGEILRQSVRAMRDNSSLRYAMAYWAVVPIAWPVMILFLQPHAVSLGVPVALIGVLVMGVNGASIFGSLLADRAGRQLGVRTILYGVPGVLVAFLLLIGINKTLLSMVFIAVLSLLIALVGPLVSRIVQESVSDEIRATILSTQSLLFTLFLAITEPALGFVADSFGLSGAYFALAGILGIFVILLALKGRRWFNPDEIGNQA